MIVDNLADHITELSDVAMSNTFPWYHHETSTRQGLPYLAHIAVPRENVNSKDQIVISPAVYAEVKRIFDIFCIKHNINYHKIYRCCLNMTYGSYDVSQTDPHVDHDIEHKLFLLYLNDCSGDTLLYKEKYSVGYSTTVILPEDNFKGTVDTRVSPQFGKAFCTDGFTFHAHEFCKPMERRLTCIVTFN